MKIGRIAIAAIIIALVLIVAAVGVFLLKAPTGTVSIYVKDAPQDWIHVNVTFSEIKIHQADAGNDSGWITLSIKNETIDLASLTDVSQLLASSNVSVGKYTQIRLVVSNAAGVMTNGTSVDLIVPSGELKTTHPFNVTADQTISLTLDIELHIHQSGQDWIFTPVIGSVSEA